MQSVINAQLRLTNQLTHLSTALNASVGGNEGGNAFYNRLNSRFSGSIDAEARANNLVVANEEKTMDTYLKHWSSYLSAEQEMLAKRTNLMLERDTAAKNVARHTKPSRVEAARAAAADKEAVFQRCSKVAAGEVRRFHQRRVAEMKETLVVYAEGQIECARESCDDLANCLAKMRDFPLPSVSNLKLVERGDNLAMAKTLSK